MSSDLWSAFATAPEDPSDNPWAQPVEQPKSNSSDKTKAPPVSSNNDTGNFNNWGANDTWHWDQQPQSTTAESWLKDEEDKQNVWGDTASNGYLPKARFEKLSSQQADAKNTDIAGVLFDAKDENAAEDDDFGDFEDPEMQIAPGILASHKAQKSVDSKHFSHDLLMLEDPNQDFSATQFVSPQISWRDEQGEAPNFTASLTPLAPTHGDIGKKRPEALSRVGPNASKDAFSHNASLAAIPYGVDEWGDFIDSPDPRDVQNVEGDLIKSATNRNASQRHPAAKSTNKHFPEVDPNSQQSASTTSAATEVVPPSNIPPPSILLPHVVATLMLKLPGELRIKTQQQTQTDNSLDVLKASVDACISTIKVGARIAAGRKLRWKRDTILSQSMSIGPAQGGKVGGMKLAGIDKAESRREDREVAEFARIWKEQSGGLRAAVASACTRGKWQPVTLPNITEVMAVRTAKAAEGAIKGPKCCVLCGLNRDERVANIDGTVEDSFGEWWTEHWGHKECRVFWEKHEQVLRQR